MADPKDYSGVKLLEFENDLDGHFKLDAHIEISNIHNENQLERWFVMQHYKCPTRLLDWTYSPYVAVYFACCSSFESDGALYVIHPWHVKQKTTELGAQGEKIYRPADINNIDTSSAVENWFKHAGIGSPIVEFVQSIKRDARMVAQQGIFSLSYDISTTLEDVLFHDIGNRESPFLKIAIRKELKIDFLRRLDLMNVNARSLYHGLDGIGQSLGERLLFQIEANS